MKFVLEFNKEIFLQQQELNIDLFWENGVKKNKRVIFSVIIILGCGTLLIYQGNYIGLLFVGYGIHSIINYMSYFFQVKKSKKKFLKAIGDEADRFLEKGKEMILEFNNNSFFYEGFDYSTTINWDTFKHFRIIGENIFLDLNVGNTVSYILSKSQIGEEKFAELIEFLKGKIKQSQL